MAKAKCGQIKVDCLDCYQTDTVLFILKRKDPLQTVTGNVLPATQY